MINNRAQKLPQFIASLSASGGAFCAGTLLGWSSPAAPRLVDEKQYFEITQDQWSWIAAIYNVGCSVSCLIVGYLMNKFGRKLTMIGFVLPFIIGWSLLIWAQNFLMMFIGRFILGIAGGAFYIAMPQYTTEIAQNDIRGILGSFLQLQISLGVLFVYTIGAYLTVYRMNIICGICPIIFAISFIFMPETPFYLITKCQENKADKSLKWLRGSDYDTRNEIEELKDNLRDRNDLNVSFREAIKEKSSINALVIGIGLLFFRHMCCIIPILFYATTIFAASGVGLSADISTIILGAMQFFSSFMASVLVDRLGRRVLLLGSIIVMTITLFAIGAFFYIQSVDSETAETLGWLPLTSLCIYILAYPVGYGGIPWLVVSEVAPKKMKAFTGPIIGFFAWNFAFLVTTSFKHMMETFGIGQTFWIFAGASFIGIFFTYFIIPETKGKSLTEIENSLNKNSSVMSK
ncbi:hypothetical protein PVAND_001618 [Polypedilum vanderplanki]|uniref:Facilitated trehalose transporter Tret1 n=1 Tax=Polypedilum vanderplanki TaxID=319348 RepID=A0A9J6BNH4_POLVA|nr:hypothetical protein PVAND_001618 [Polypedilum vanderplanki]